MTTTPILRQLPLFPDLDAVPKKPENKPNLHTFWLHQEMLPVSIPPGAYRFYIPMRISVKPGSCDRTQFQYPYSSSGATHLISQILLILHLPHFLQQSRAIDDWVPPRVSLPEKSVTSEMTDYAFCSLPSGYLRIKS